ncbi:hypothetical protein A1O3_03005 [Capronia epimyces CBS 606.96]|uniref:NmrA-like domain-containing protein n=1 Tax=Capronia epimyces CBS 606.96 TaxID=1182542 RepID=W9YBS1_9EURO|nr:uncharacterized protein A1O3_03005 [Capronia epimyces CBS 606.96]EXJ89938.1 hypothetical protein A1O3_03005 [Capronia epimyces CBS 606.96]
MVSSPIQNVIVIGASGNVGPSIVKALQSDASFSLSILARQSSSASYPSGVPVHRVDDSYPEKEVLNAFRGQDAVVCALSLQILLQQIKFIDLAVEAGVRWFIPAEFGANNAGHGHGEKIPPHDAKEAVHEHLVRMQSKGLSWTAIATGPFIDWGIANGFLGFDLQARRAKIYDTGDEIWTGTKVSTIGVAVARLLRKPDQVKNQYIHIYSVRTSQNQILAALEAVTAKVTEAATTTNSQSAWEVERVTMEDEIARGRKMMEDGNRLGAVPLILSYFFRPGMGPDYSRDVEAANALLDLPTERIEDIVGEVVTVKG